jgi:hypothetical protein
MRNSIIRLNTLHPTFASGSLTGQSPGAKTPAHDGFVAKHRCFNPITENIDSWVTSIRPRRSAANREHPCKSDDQNIARCRNLHLPNGFIDRGGCGIHAEHVPDRQTPTIVARTALPAYAATSRLKPHGRRRSCDPLVVDPHSRR